MNARECVFYVEMPLQQTILTEESQGQLLCKHSTVQSVRRAQPLTSSPRRDGDPLVRMCIARSVILARADAIQRAPQRTWSAFVPRTSGQPATRSVFSPLQ